MAFSVKQWFDRFGSGGSYDQPTDTGDVPDTPLDAAGQRDQETRLSAYTDSTLAAHTGAATAAHAASAVSFSPTGSVGSTTAQAAIAEVASEAASALTSGLAGKADLSGGHVPVAQLGSGTAASGKYVDGASGAWLPLPAQSGHVIQDEGTPLPAQAALDFQGAGVTAADGSGKTVITIPGGGSASDASTTVKGITKLATAPASAGAPIAVGDNDPRVTADQAAGSASIRTLGTGAAQAAAGNHTHTKTDVGLGNVDNTSDANKPVSTAQAAADALALAKASNLSDVANAATARTNLGLGTAATQATGAFAPASAAADATNALSTALGQSFGLSDGVPVKPWTVPAPIGPELAVVANLRTGFDTTLPIATLTANSTNLSSRTLVELGNLANRDKAFRVSMTLVSLPSNGWASIRLRPVDAGGNLLSPDEQVWITNSGYCKTGETYLFDFRAGSWATGGTWLEIRLDVFNNASAGALQVSNLSVKEIGAPQRPILYTESSSGSPGYPQVFTPLFDAIAGSHRMALTEIADDGALTRALVNVTGYNTDRPFRFGQPDPDFAATSLGVTGFVGDPEILLGADGVAKSLRAGNNDQIMEVLKQDGTTWELRGNVHGGETLRSTSSPNLVYEVDKGDGAWLAWDGLGKMVRTCRRLRWTWNTKIARSSPDSDDIVNVDHISTFFPDGMMRLDRTTTFLKAVRLRNLFAWMSSHDITVGAIGRTGVGSRVLDEVDIYPKLAVPAAPTAATSTSGGTLAAGTYMYAITALTEDGETTRSPLVTKVTTGSTSTVTLTLPAAATGQTGFRVYGRANNSTRLVRLATILASAATWVDDGSLPASGSFPPNVNTARRLDTASIDNDWAISDQATWAVWYDQATNLCMGNIYDRNTLITRAGVAGVKMRLGGTPGSIRKNYLTVHWAGDGSPSYPESETALIASGTVWTETHYAFTYCPEDPVNYHNEIVLRAANLTALASLYPAT